MKRFLITSGVLFLATFPVAYAFVEIGPEPPHVAVDQEPPEQKAPPQDTGKTSDTHTQAMEAYNHGVELFQIAQMQAEKGDIKGQESLLKEAIKTFEKALSLQSNLVDAQ